MMLIVEKLFTYLFLLIPLFLITGPAIPDITISVGVLFGIFYIVLSQNYRILYESNFLIISILFWFSLIFISLFAYNKINSFQDSIIYIRILLIPIFCYFVFFRDSRIFKYSLLLIFVLIIFVCVDTIYQFLNYTSRDGFGKDMLGFKSNWYGRLTGPFGDELIPGSYVSKFGLFGFAFLISNKRFQNKTIIQSIYLSLILFVSYVSGERMSFATFSLGLLVLFIFLNDFRKSILLSIIIGLSLILITLYLHPFYNDYTVIESTQFHQGQKIEKMFKCNNETEEMCYKIIDIQPSFFKIIQNFSTSAYGEIYLLSFKMFLDNPITGIGINNFKFLCNHIQIYKNMMANYDCASHPHNIYIQWLVEGGLIVFIFFLVYLFYVTFFIIKNDGDKKNKIISLVVILIMFWPIMSTGSLIKNWYGVTTFYIIGLCICNSRFKINNYN